MSAVDSPGLTELARRQQPVRGAADPAEAADRLRLIREQLESLPPTARAAQPATIAAATGPIEELLSTVADPTGEPLGDAEWAVIGRAARGLVACFYASRRFADGLPGEVRATTTVLDALDEDRDGSRDPRHPSAPRTRAGCIGRPSRRCSAIWRSRRARSPTPTTAGRSRRRIRSGAMRL